MKWIRRASEDSGSDTRLTVTTVIATRKGGSTIAVTGTLVCAETQARQMEFEKSFSACTCAICKTTASRTNKAHERTTQCFGRLPNVPKM